MNQVTSIRMYNDTAVDSVRLNTSTQLQFSVIEGGVLVTLTTALSGGDGIIFYASGGSKIVGIEVPRF